MGQAFGFEMVNVIVLFPVNVIDPGSVTHEGTLVGVSVGVKVRVGVLVTVGERVAVGVCVGDGVILGVFVITGVFVTVFVGVLVGGGDVGVRVLVEVMAMKVLGGTVTKIETPTKTVRALCATIGLGGVLLLERSRNPTILGTIGT